MKKIYLFALLSLLAASCVKENLDSKSGQSINLNEKIVNSSDNAIAGRLLVKFVGGTTDFGVEAFGDYAVSAKQTFAWSDANADKIKSAGMDLWYTLTFSKEYNIADVAAAVAADSRIARVEYDKPLKRKQPELMPAPLGEELDDNATRATEMPFNDPYLYKQWNLMNDATVGESALVGADINAFNAWKYTTGDKRIIVAVVDEAVMYDHVDLNDNMWVNEAEANGAEGVDDDGNGYIDDVYGYNFCDDVGDITYDGWSDLGYDSGHATHVAGIIAAETNNNRYVAGIAGGSGNGDGCRIMSCQVFSAGRVATTEGFAAAFIYAADNGASVINNSWGYETTDAATNSEYAERYSVLQDAIDYFESNAGNPDVIDGGIVVFAAGNSGDYNAMFPAAVHDIIGVGSIAPDFRAAYYTNYGPGVNLCAPGGDQSYGNDYAVYSTTYDANKYGFKQGTSMACPHVAGVAALGLSYAIQNGYHFSAREFRDLIVTSTHDIDKYQHGTKTYFNFTSQAYESMDLSAYRGNLGTGLIDAHLLIMQIQKTPCLYTATNSDTPLSLDVFFGETSERLTYTACDVPAETAEALGITTTPEFKDGKLVLKCTKPGVGRITVHAQFGGNGTADFTDMELVREFEVVVRRATANNGGWL